MPNRARFQYFLRHFRSGEEFSHFLHSEFGGTRPTQFSRPFLHDKMHCRRLSQTRPRSGSGAELLACLASMSDRIVGPPTLHISLGPLPLRPNAAAGPYRLQGSCLAAEPWSLLLVSMSAKCQPMITPRPRKATRVRLQGMSHAVGMTPQQHLVREAKGRAICATLAAQPYGVASHNRFAKSAVPESDCERVRLRHWPRFCQQSHRGYCKLLKSGR